MLWNKKILLKKNEYIGDKILLWLDGIWNDGYNSHKTNITNWKDLSENNFPGTINSSMVINEDNIYSSGAKYIAYPQSQFNITNNFTIEVVLKKDTEQENLIICGRSHRNSYYINTAAKQFTFWTNNSSSIANNSINANEKVNIAVTYSNGTVYMYKNGTLVTIANDKTLQSTNDPFYIFAAYSNTINCFKGNIYALRFHKRVLSDNEIKFNYLIDKKRFNLN